LTVADVSSLRKVTSLILVMVSFCVVCSADARTKILGCTVHNGAVKCAWKDSNAFVVLNYGAECSD